MTRPSPNRCLAGFTLTEVMIALAMTAFLLIGISKIFALTSSTISAGQAMAKAMRSQRAIQQLLSNDFLGSGGDIGDSAYSSGLLPLNNSIDVNYAMPYLEIASFRVPTYANQADFAAAVNVPPDIATVPTAAQYRTRSRQIRSIDFNNNGVIDASENPISIYTYGQRSFRTDTLTFFERGKFQSQSGSNGRYQDRVTSNVGMIWYGHLRTYNSNAAALNTSAGYGNPGEWVTPGASGTANLNNRFADQFRLGRYQFLMIEPTDHDGIAGTTTTDLPASPPAPAPPAPGLALWNLNTVTVDGDPTQPIFFVQRNYWDPSYVDPNISASARRPAAFNLAGGIYEFDPTSSPQQNQTVKISTDLTTGSGSSWNAAMGRTDIFGTGVKTLRKRIGVMQNTDLTSVPTSGSEWWQFIPSSRNDRYYGNPFPVQPLTPAGLAQQRLIVADATSQFIVEFAGDFITQDATGAVTAATPDGVLDFALVNNVRQTRWYGMPRDVNGDGTIPGTTNANVRTSPDVIPLRDLRNAVSPFEKNYPAPLTDYATVLDEPASTRGNGKGVNGSPDDTSYLCIWGPNDFASKVTPIGGTASYYDQVPQLIRVLTDIRDPDGKIKEALTQEYVFPVRVTGAVKPPSTTP